MQKLYLSFSLYLVSVHLSFSFSRIISSERAPFSLIIIYICAAPLCVCLCKYISFYIISYSLSLSLSLSFFLCVYLYLTQIFVFSINFFFLIFYLGFLVFLWREGVKLAGTNGHFRGSGNWVLLGFGFWNWEFLLVGFLGIWLGFRWQTHLGLIKKRRLLLSMDTWRQPEGTRATGTQGRRRRTRPWSTTRVSLWTGPRRSKLYLKKG